jgi:hypothetical protein
VEAAIASLRDEGRAVATVAEPARG